MGLLSMFILVSFPEHYMNSIYLICDYENWKLIVLIRAHIFQE